MRSATTPAPTSVLEHAIAYAEIGWLVVPLHWPIINGTAHCSCGKPDCASPAKHPLTAHGLKDATRDVNEIRRWWFRWPVANIGIATGAESGIVVLDVDPDKGGETSIAELMDEHGDIPETVESATGGNGAHLCFAHPGRRIGNSSEKIGAGLDIRGDGGYIVAPPSLHVSGRKYAWRELSSPHEREPSAIPAWLLELVKTQEPEATKIRETRIIEDDGQRWLGKALAKTDEGHRNETGHWLACQLRDNRVPLSRAESIMLAYQDRTPRGAKPYTAAEALATVRSCYETPAREPAIINEPEKKPATPKAPNGDASEELHNYLRGVVSGRIYNVPFPWQQLTHFTNALLPSSTCTICGDPGVGKTFFVLDCLKYWHANGFDPAIMFIEKDRCFHTHRLLAQLEGKGSFVSYEWIKRNGNLVDEAMRRHAGLIDELGRCIFSSPRERLTLGALLLWVREQAEAGKRVILIDPITLADAGRERWTVDDDFMDTAEKVMTDHGASLVLITHPRKGNRNGSQSGHDQAGGAAYHRFADTNIWLHKPKKPRLVKVVSPYGAAKMRCHYFFQMHKTRNGKGAGAEIAFEFGEGLRFAEQGLVTGDAKDDEEGETA